MELYHVIENRNVSILCSPEFVETILFTGSKEDCEIFLKKKLAEDYDELAIEYFIQSECQRNELAFK